MIRRSSRAARFSSVRAPRLRERCTAALLMAYLGSVYFGLAVAAPGSAHAQPVAEPGRAASPSREEQAREKFRQARRLLDEGRFQEACRRFEESLALASSPGTLLNLGNCYQQPGDLLRALAAFQRALEEAPREPDPERRRAWTEAARERVETISKRVPQLTVHPSPTAGVEVFVDGERMEQLGTPVRLNPGSHRIEARAEGMAPFVQQITLVPSQKLDVTLPALAPGSSSGAPPPADTESPPAAGASIDSSTDVSGRQESRFGVVPWVLVGGGAAVFASGMITGLLAKSKADELDEQCSDTRDAADRRVCDPSLAGTADTAETLAVVTDVLWIGGLLVAGAGVTLLVLDDGGSESSAHLEAGCFLGGCGLTAQGQF